MSEEGFIQTTPSHLQQNIHCGLTTKIVCTKTILIFKVSLFHKFYALVTGLYTHYSHLNFHRKYASYNNLNIVTLSVTATKFTVRIVA